MFYRAGTIPELFFRCNHVCFCDIIYNILLTGVLIMDIKFRHNGHTFSIKGDSLVISKNRREMISVCLAPSIGNISVPLLNWHKNGDNCWKCPAEGFGSVNAGIRDGYPCIWLDTDTKFFESLTYFRSITFAGHKWATFVSDELDRTWDIAADTDIPISSCYADLFHPDGHDGSGPMDPGDKPPLFNWNMHVRAAALQTFSGWTGLLIPGPLPVGITRFRSEKGCISLTFEAVRSTCPDWGMPAVYIQTGLPDKDCVLDHYRILSDAIGITVKKNPDHPVWWANPVFDSWEEICRLLKTGRSEESDVPAGEEYMQAVPEPEYTNAGNYITLDNNRLWLDQVRKSTGISSINTTFEQGCFRLYGDYRPIDGLGGTDGLRRLTDEWRSQGVHAAYYLHPFLTNTKTEFHINHPEAFCRPKDPGYKLAYAIEFHDRSPEYALLDWTHPEARKHMSDIVRYMLSSEPGCLNCDILRSNHWRAPDPRYYDFFDPDWGTGDLMSMKVQKLLYETAKEVKPDCMVSKVGFADPYMQPWADMDYLSEEWSYNTENWFRRARIAARTIRGCLFLVDPFVATLTKITETFTSFLAFSIPATTMVEHALHPQMFYRNLREIDHRRRRSGFKTYMNAPIHISDISSVDWSENDRDVSISRIRTDGPMAGWYAARSFGRKSFITYSETEALIASCINRLVSAEIPSGYSVDTVTVTGHDMSESEVAHTIRKTHMKTYVDLYVTDCGKEAMYYRIKYSRNSALRS